MKPRIGSLFTGTGALDRAAGDVFGADLAWVADNLPAARALLAHHHPHVPNLGDVTDLDWSAVAPATILTAGFPCQPFSTLGARRGTGDMRWLWHHIEAAIDTLEPGVLVFENVAALLHDDVALAAIIDALSRRGYVGAWRCVAAGDIGAPHPRSRVFILAARPSSRGLLAAAADPRRRTVDRASAQHGDALDSASARRPRRPVDGLDAAATGWAWGGYQATIARWEALLGRACPHPIEWWRGKPRPRIAFLEWMMGLPRGHLTAVPSLSWGQAHRLAGNGVVPQQAEAALRQLTVDVLAELDRKVHS